MPASIAPPPPAAPRRKRRMLLPPFFQNPETRSIEIGVVATILVHLLMLLLLPRIFLSGGANSMARLAPPHKFDLEFEPPPPQPKPRPPPMKFVEANPNANNNIPDKTNNFAAQNQTVAQEKPNPKGSSDMPTLEGRKDIHSTQIVTGTLQPQVRTPPAPAPQTAQTKPSVSPPKREQNPLTGFDKSIGDTKDAYGTNVGKLPDQAQDVQRQVSGTPDAPINDSATSMIPKIDPLHPQPRRFLAQHVRPAVFSENKLGTKNIGPIALDARWSNYGEYLQRLIESVQIEWDRILESSAVYPPSGTTVSVKFVIDSKGRITRIVDVESTSSEQGKQACESAITNRSPYGEWTADMIAMLGQQQEMTFMFYYE